MQENRYSVPRGTYKGANTIVGVNKINNEYIIISDLDTGNEIAKHEIPQTKGNLVSNKDHKRDKSEKIETMIKKMTEKFDNQESAKMFLDGIHTAKSRYIRDQLMVIDSAMKSYNSDSINRALDYCLKNRLLSAADFTDTVKHYSKISVNCDVEAEITAVKGLSDTATDKMTAKAYVRDIKVYAEIINGTKGGVKYDK